MLTAMTLFALCALCTDAMEGRPRSSRARSRSGLQNPSPSQYVTSVDDQAKVLIRRMLQKAVAGLPLKVHDFLELRVRQDSQQVFKNILNVKQKILEFGLNKKKKADIYSKYKDNKAQLEAELGRCKWKNTKDNTRAEFGYIRIFMFLEAALQIRVGHQCYDSDMIGFLFDLLECIKMTETNRMYKDTVTTWSGTKTVMRKHYEASINEPALVSLCKKATAINVAKKLLWLLRRACIIDQTVVQPLKKEHASVTENLKSLRKGRRKEKDKQYDLKAKLFTAEEKTQYLELQVQRQPVPEFDELLWFLEGKKLIQ